MSNTTRDTYGLLLGKRYRKVIFQQGVPAVDADLNEPQDVLWDAVRQAVMEGGLDGKTWAESTAFPRGSRVHAGFRPKESVSSNVNNFTLRAGTIWRNGKRYTLDTQLEYTAQVDENGSTLPALTTPSSNRTDCAYLEVFETEIDGTEDTNLINSSIGIETARRTKLVALVRVRENNTAPPAPTTGRQNYPLALFKRLAGNTTITRAMIQQLPVDIYVGVSVGTTGFDTNDGLTSGKSLATLTEALRRVPRILNEDWRILVQPGGGTGGGGAYTEPLTLAGILTTPRHPDDTNTVNKLFRTNDGRQRSTYELSIEPIGFDTFPTNVWVLDGSSWVDQGSFVANCHGFTLRGLVTIGGPLDGLLISGCTDFHLVGCAFTAATGNGLAITRSTTGRVWNINCSLNTLAGLFLSSGSNLTIEGDFEIHSNVFAGVVASRASQVSLGANDSMGVNHAVFLNKRRVHSNGDNVRIEHGSKATVGDLAASLITSIYNGFRGIVVRYGSYALVQKVDIGPVVISGVSPPSVSSMLVSDGSAADVLDTFMDGNMVASLSAVGVTRESAISMQGVTIQDFTLHAVDLSSNSMLHLNEALGATGAQTIFDFSGSNSSVNARIRVRTGSTVSVQGLSNLPPLATDPMTIVDGNGLSSGSGDRSTIRLDGGRFTIGGSSYLWAKRLAASASLFVGEVRNGAQWYGASKCHQSTDATFPAAGGAVDKFTDFSTEFTGRNQPPISSVQSSDRHHCTVSDNADGSSV